MHNFIGLDLLDIRDNEVSVKLNFDEQMIGDLRDNTIRGGIIAAAMDAVGGAVAMKNFASERDQLSTINMSVNYPRRTKPKDIVIDAKVVKNGQRIIFTEMSAHHVDEDNQILATANAAFSYLKSSMALNCEEKITIGANASLKRFRGWSP